MSRQVSNTDIITDSWEIAILQLNELLYSLSTEMLTANITYANTGNSTFSRTAQLYGTFGANTLTVTNWARGGNVNGGFANLNISTNTILSNTSASNLQIGVSNTASYTYINPIGGYFGNGTSNSAISTTSVILQTSSTVNTNISASLVQVTNSTASANVTTGGFRTGIFVANATHVAVGSNVVFSSESLSIGNSTVNTVIVANGTSAFIDTDGFLRVLGNTVLSNTLVVTGNVTLSNTLSVTGNTTLSNSLAVTGNVALSNTLSVTGNTSLSNTLAVTGNTVLSNTLVVTGNVTLSNTLSVVGNTSLSNTLSVTGAVAHSNTLTVTGLVSTNTGLLIQNNYLVENSSNTDIGNNIAGLTKIYSFPKATYNSAKMMVQVRNTGNTQIAEMVVAHDGSAAYVTVYGVVAAPPAGNTGTSPLGTFSANVNNANVDLLISQTIANSSVNIVAHLMK